jgi:hypothetical protein
MTCTLFTFILAKFQFRFANRADHIMLFIGMCAVFLQSAFFVTYIWLYSRLTGILAIHSFNNSCRENQQQNSSVIASLYRCSFGIDLNSINYDHLYKYVTGKIIYYLIFHNLSNRFCNVGSTTQTPPLSSMVVFRANTWSKVYLLLSNLIGGIF